jgi:hypothetical protein
LKESDGCYLGLAYDDRRGALEDGPLPHHLITQEEELLEIGVVSFERLVTLLHQGVEGRLDDVVLVKVGSVGVGVSSKMCCHTKRTRAESSCSKKEKVEPAVLGTGLSNFLVSCLSAFFMETAPVPLKHKKYCVDVSRPERTGMHHVTHKSHRMQKHKFGITCHNTLFMKTAPGPLEHEK